MKHLLIVALLFTNIHFLYSQKKIIYHLHVQDTMVNYTGKLRKAIAINGQLPAPTLYFTEGDTAEIFVHNHMHHETSIHWHGLLLPNEQDGVPYLTTTPIKGHTTHQYYFVLKQSGTYWYHSHSMLQEQIGMYGAIVIYKKEEVRMPEQVVLLSDWSDEKPEQIERSLHFATDWYGIRKGAAQSYGEALLKKKAGVKFENEFKRMLAMDVSDVYYEKIFMNGYTEQNISELKKGDSIRLRVINGSSATYFWLEYSGGKITVVASDGADVKPVEVDRLIVGVSEIYDIIVTIPENGTYQFRATSEDRINNASLWLGNGERHEMPPMGRLQYFEGMKMMNDMMTVGGNMYDMGMNMSLQQMDMNTVMYPEITGTTPHNKKHHHDTDTVQKEIVTLNYAMLEAPAKTNLPDAPYTEYHFELTGNMNRYVWTVNNKTISESDKILIKPGQNIRIIMTNNSMMRHPMHLHGHFFRVLNGKGDYAPLKNVLDIMPMETDTIEFNASEEYGEWYFHCHILYHMMSGMGRIFTYENTPPNPQLPDVKKAQRMVYHDDRRFYNGAEISIESNGSDGELIRSNTRWFLQTEWRLGFSYNTGFEWESHIGRYIDRKQFLSAYTGWDLRSRHSEHEKKNIFGQQNTKDQRGVFCLGIRYVLPWFIESDFRIDHTGNLRLQFSRHDIPVTSRLRLWATVNSDLEYSIGSRYIITKYISVSSHYDSDMRWGAGVTVTY